MYFEVISGQINTLKLMGKNMPESKNMVYDIYNTFFNVINNYIQ